MTIYNLLASSDTYFPPVVTAPLYDSFNLGVSSNLIRRIKRSDGELFVVGLGRNSMIWYTVTGTEWFSLEVIPITTNVEFKDFFYNGAHYVLVGNSGFIMTSLYLDIDWVVRTSGVATNLNGVTCSSTTIVGFFWVVVGDTGTILTSTDAGVTWTPRTSGTTNNLNRVIFRGGTFVAVGDAGTILTSTNGTSWAVRTSGTVNALRDIIYSSVGSLFVAVGDSGTIVTSSDGTTWTVRTSGTTQRFNGVANSSTIIVAAGVDGGISTSTNGTTWTVRTTATSTTNSAFGGIGYFSSFMIVGFSHQTSTDGISWTLDNRHKTLSAFTYRSVLWHNNTYYFMGSNTQQATSTNLITWTTGGTVPTTSGQVRSARGASEFVHVSGTGVWTSPDWVTWTARTSNTTNTLLGLVYSSTLALYVAVGQSGTIITSPTGTTWTLRTSGTTNNLNGVTWAGNLFVAVGDTGTILTSSDGTTWIARTSGTTNNLTDVAAGGGRIVAVSNSISLVTVSSDGINWKPTGVTLKYQYTASEISSSAQFTRIIWAGNKFIAGTNIPTIHTTIDGRTWYTGFSRIPALTSGNFTINDIASAPTGNAIFVASGGTGGAFGSYLMQSGNTFTASYAFTSVPTSINEGSAGTFTVSAASVANGTTLYWTINHITTVEADFLATSGSFTINNSTGSFLVTPFADSITEGSQTFEVQVRLTNVNGTVVVTSNPVTINDVSVSPSFTSSLEMIAGGGGGGGGGNGMYEFYVGAGGAGGYLYYSALTISQGIDYNVTIGEGGAGGLANADSGDGATGGIGQNGGNSIFGNTFETYTAIGGGGGSYGFGSAGGSGGGSGGAFNRNTGGSGTAGPPRQGYNGGNGAWSAANPNNGGGGGGGGINGSGSNYGENGTGASSTQPGGLGLNFAIDGVYRGVGGTANGSAVDASTNTGNGGNGGKHGPSGTGATSGRAGGSGIVIVKYPNSAADPVISGTLTSTISSSGSDRILKLLSGTGTVNWPSALPPTTVEYLVVGGGGSGGGARTGNHNAGGGGGGGVSYSTSGFVVNNVSSYTVTVGEGGPGPGGSAAGSNGQDSVFGTVLAKGGGAGGGAFSATNGANGGCGGGGAGGGAGVVRAGGTATHPSLGSYPNGSGFGRDGGLGTGPSYSGGGGGAGLPGADGTASVINAAGGNGVSIPITGVSVYYAGGGGAGGGAGVGGAGGGGQGALENQPAAGPVTGTTNLGGGGGGGASGGVIGGAAGGRGVVVIAYPTSFSSISSVTGTLVYTLDTVTRPGYKVYKFTQGTGSISWANSPTYSVIAPSSIDEGSAGTFTVNTSNVNNGTTLYWTISHGTSVADDFSSTSGSFVVNSSQGTFTVTPSTDSTTEGNQTFAVQIRTNDISGTVVATSATVTINDTSVDPQSFAFNTVPSSINEGSAGAFSITTTNVSDGTTLYWTVNHISTNASDFTSESGSFTITSNAGSFNVTTTADETTEGSETFQIQIRTGSISGSVVATSSSVTINDTSLTRTYSVTGASSVNEGSNLALSVTTSNVPNGTTLYWTISHGTTAAADFSATSGSFSISANAGSFNVTTVADETTEGNQTFSVEIRTVSTSGTVVATAGPITVVDTSLTRTYSFGTIPTSINEGSSGTFNVTTTNVPNSTTLYWTISNTTTANADFSSTSGSFTITSNAGSFSVTTSADATTEGSQSFQVQLRTGSTSGTVVATSNSVTINDTSTTPQLSPTIQLLTNYTIPVTSLQTKASGIRITRDTSGPASQNWSITTSLTVQSGAGNGVSSGTLTTSSTNAVVIFQAPHNTTNVTVNVTGSGYTSFSNTYSISAVSIYSPYNFSRGYPQESGADASRLNIATQLNGASQVYRSNNAFTTSSGTRYGLFRAPDYAGVNFWANWAFVNNAGSITNQNFYDNFFGGLGGNDLTRSQTNSKSFDSGTGYNALYDRP